MWTNTRYIREATFLQVVRKSDGKGTSAKIVFKLLGGLQIRLNKKVVAG
jgi:hypothetical protein